MWTIFSYSIRKKSGIIIGWGIGLMLLGILLVSMYDMIIADSGIDFNQYMEMLPPEMMALFGGTADFSTPAGFLSMEYFSYLPLILGFVVVGQAGNLFVGLEEEGLLDLYLAYPVRRLNFFVGRVFAEFISLVLLLMMAYLGTAIPLEGSSMDIGYVELIGPFLSLFAILYCFFGVSVLLSLLMPSRGAGVTVSNLFLILSFFINGFSGVNENLEFFAKFSPFHYYQMAYNLVDGFNYEWFFGLVGVGLVCILITMVLFERRDIRVSGEGSWQFLSFLSKKAKRNSGAIN